MVLRRKSCLFKLVNHKAVTSNCLAVQPFSKQELEISFVYNPNDETDKINNLSKALDHLAENGSKNQLIIEDYNTSTELDYLHYSQDPHRASREFLHGLQEDEIFIDVYRFLYPYDLSYTWKLHNSQKRSTIDLAFANQNLISVESEKGIAWNSKEVSDHAMVTVKDDFENNRAESRYF